MNIEYTVYHSNLHEAEFNFIDRGAWCQENCNGKFEINVHEAYFNQYNDYINYLKRWEYEQYLNNSF